MEDRSLEKLEAGVDRLLKELSRLRSENGRLLERIAGLDAGKTLCRERLDQVISRLEQVDAQ